MLIQATGPLNPGGVGCLWNCRSSAHLFFCFRRRGPIAVRVEDHRSAPPKTKKQDGGREAARRYKLATPTGFAQPAILSMTFRWETRMGKPPSQVSKRTLRPRAGALPETDVAPEGGRAPSHAGQPLRCGQATHRLRSGKLLAFISAPFHCTLWPTPACWARLPRRVNSVS